MVAGSRKEKGDGEGIGFVGVGRALLPAKMVRITSTLFIHHRLEPTSCFVMRDYADKSVRATQTCSSPIHIAIDDGCRTYKKPMPRSFATFNKLTCEPFCPRARDLVLEHCLYEHGKRIELYVAVIMPEHVPLLFRPLRDLDGWPIPLHKILRSIKGISARDINKALGTSGPVWQDESFDHVVRSHEGLISKADYIRMNPVRRAGPHT